MINTPYALKDSRPNRAWLALAACMSYAGIEPVSATDMPPAAAEAIAPAAIEAAPVPAANFIPADNPIGSLLLSRQHPLLARADFSRVSDFVVQIYQANNFQPIWLNANRSEKNLNDLFGMLDNAAGNALSPASYDVERLKQFVGSPVADNATAAGYDVALTVSLVRFLHDLRQGRVDPRDVQYPVHIAPKPALDIAGLLKQHLETQTLSELAAVFEPKAKQYQQLKRVWNRMQLLAGQSALHEFKPGKQLRPGDKHPHIVYLRQNLLAMGLIADNVNPESKVYDADLVEAVKKVQQQQGLKADGVIGVATAALFNRPPQEKLAQLELAMERSRWIPDPSDGPMILVNIPAFELWAFNSPDDANPLNMKVIVGKSPDKQTPVLWEEMKYLEFMPYWNIPKNIFEKEILPKAANNQGYLASQDIELVRHQNSEEKGGGSYLRARQRPGKKNPLGRVKFVFPNTADVYLHDTPSRAAFNRPRRDLSHGCVRVAEPKRLAEFVLGDQQGWDKDTIEQAMSAPKTRHVTLKRSVPVLFYYATTFIDHADQLHVYPDIYGQDELLQKALNKLQAPTAGTNQLAASGKAAAATSSQ
ncbi:L,D-transpeptidase family protein [Methylomonas sp. HW2-6]|uniref:L,D-transpeptidase family protein n=1 Tax=Methylomonas sp. HW2-6 TaxID=3376687 RepID=UPI004040EB93